MGGKGVSVWDFIGRFGMGVGVLFVFGLGRVR